MRDDQVPCKAHNRLGCLLCWERADGDAPPKGGNVPHPRDRDGRTLGIPTRIEYDYYVYGDSVYGRPGSARRYEHHNDDTAPFDTVAFNNYLKAASQAGSLHSTDCNCVYDDYSCTCISHPDHPGTDYVNRRANALDGNYESTHYYGDDCPGGHFDSEHPGPDNDDDRNYWESK